MAEITAQMVMDLRQKTGAKMMDAKRALVDTDGDFNKAIDLLREKGQADAAKRTHRATAEGVVAAASSETANAGALAEVNCETDFVAKTDQFQAVVSALANFALTHGGETTGDDLPEDVLTQVKDAISKTGENIQYRRGIAITSPTGVVGTYIHLGGKIGVLAQLDGGTSEAARALAKDLAMHIAANSPDYLVREDVPTDVLDREMEIYRNLARNEGKPDNLLDRIAQGRLEKFYKDNCLLEQPFVKDTDKAVAAVVAETGKATGEPLAVTHYVRFQLGQ